MTHILYITDIYTDRYRYRYIQKMCVSALSIRIETMTTDSIAKQTLNGLCLFTLHQWRWRQTKDRNEATASLNLEQN